MGLGGRGPEYNVYERLIRTKPVLELEELYPVSKALRKCTDMGLPVNNPHSLSSRWVEAP